MSKYDIKLKERKESIIINKILTQDENGPIGFPQMTVKDVHGREHILTAVDFLPWEWEKIKVGSVILVSISERVDSAKVR